MKFLKTLGAITYEMWCGIRYVVVSNVYNVAVIASAILPYAMYVLGQYLAVERGYIGFGGELAIPVVVGIVVHYMKEIGNRANKGKRVPVPAQRFTSVDEDGEVSIEQDRLNELILYMADLEDWFDKRGML